MGRTWEKVEVLAHGSGEYTWCVTFYFGRGDHTDEIVVSSKGSYGDVKSAMDAAESHVVKQLGRPSRESPPD